MTGLGPFRYERPSSLEELRTILSSHGPDRIRFLAGGTDLIPAMRRGKESPDVIIDLKGLPGMAGIASPDGQSLLIGALTRIHALESDPRLQSRATALFEAARYLGSWQVRNRATIGGNLANGAPTADSAAPMLALDGKIVIWGPAGERRIRSDSFWVDAGKTALGPGEIILRVEVPVLHGMSSAYIKLGTRQAMEIAIVSAAVALTTENNTVREIRIGLGGAGATPLRAVSAEEYAGGRPATDETITEVGRLAAADSNPRSSVRASREYRLKVIPVLVERAMRLALGGQRGL